MKVSVLKNQSINNIILPNSISGTYWIDGFDINGNKINLISIEAENGKWKINSNKDVYLINNNVMVPFSYLEIGKFYIIKNDLDNNTFVIYCSLIEEKYNCYEINEYLDNGLLVGSKNKCNINYSILDDISCSIKRENDKIYLNVFDKKNAVYVNNFRIINKQELKNGDIIFISGLRMIFSLSSLSKTGYILYVNNITISNITTSMLPIGQISASSNDFVEPENEMDFQMYNDNDYFYKKPRIVPTLEEIKIRIDDPPAKQDDKENPFLLTIGPMITMSMTSMVMGYNTINNISTGATTLKAATPSLVICGAMFASIFIWPLLTRLYQKIEKARKEKKRQKKYGKYIDNKREEINQARNNQAEALNLYYLNSKEASEVIINKSPSLWQKRKTDEDYLTVNIGTGNYPMKIDMQFSEEKFTLNEDNLRQMALDLGNEPKVIENVAIPYSFKTNYISGIYGLNNLHNFVRRLLIQILAFHSYDDLKIVILTDENTEHEWKFLKQVPHLFSDNKNIRFFAANNDEYKEVCYYLKKVYDNNLNNKNSANQSYLIITDAIKKVREYDVIKNVLESNEYNDFSILILDKKMTNIPDQCTSFLDLSLYSNKYKECEVKNNLNVTKNIKFIPDLESEIDYESCAKVLANIPIDIKSDEEGKLPNKISFLEMYDVGKVEQLNSFVRWQKNNPILNLNAPVGIGRNGEVISIDLHEKYHGPHGLIAGMTGSGKSEFIITYILSMAINFHPDEVQFILIDYKGGGLAGAFENKITGVKLPHLVGTITNLDANEIKRSLASIESELKRRQSLFNKAREATNESTIDIYKYQKLYRQGVIKDPVSHLFIICDEFAELKNQQRDFMDELISAARIGRSLGVHLILATQKPSGVVDPQIWSNTRFRVCLRVQDTSDSNEVIKKSDAAYLKNTGRFYFQVGYDEVFTIGQAAYAGAQYKPSEKITKELDTSIDLINNLGYVVKKQETKERKVEVVASLGEELINIVKYLDSIAKEHNIKTNQLWLEKLPQYINIESLIRKYNYQKKENFIFEAIIGEYDIPNKQEQKLLTLPITKGGNTVVYGTAGSGKENFIISTIYSAMLYYSPNEVNFYIIDYGSGVLNIFKDCAMVGDILKSGEEEKIRNLIKMIQSLINERKRMFEQYNGDYVSFIKTSGKFTQNIVVIINNFESFQENYDLLTEELNIITRDCTKYGIYFLLTSTTYQGVRYKLKQNFPQIYTLQQNSKDDYTSILGNLNNVLPAKVYGRGLIKLDNVYEYQTAMVAEKDKINEFIKDKINVYNNTTKIVARRVPVLPEKVTFKDIQYNLGKNYVIGINKNDMSIAKYDFDKNTLNVISMLDLFSTSKFINPLINQIVYNKKVQLIVVNAEDYDIDENNINKYQYLNSNFDDAFNKIYSFVEDNYNKYVQSNYDKNVFNGFNNIYCMIIGIDSFLNKISKENKSKLENLFKYSTEVGLVKFIIVDSLDKIKKYQYESWYKDSTNTNFGIWIGNGMDDQYVINVTQRLADFKVDVPNNFCFVVNRGKPAYVKFVEEFPLD